MKCRLSFMLLLIFLSGCKSIVETQRFQVRKIHQKNQIIISHLHGQFFQLITPQHFKSMLPKK